MSTKIHATVDALGNPTGFHLTGGQACDLEGADVLLPELEAGILLADKGFDADKRVLIPWQKAGKTAVIPPAQSQPQNSTGLRQGALQSAPPDRELLRQAQAVSRHRHQIRQDRT